MKIKLLLKIIKSIWNKDFIIISDGKVLSNIRKSDKAHVYGDIITSLNEHIVNDLGSDIVQQNLETINNEMFNLYKEVDYQVCRADYLEAEMLYYKEVNNPLGGDANRLYMLYNRYINLKKKFESFL